MMSYTYPDALRLELPKTAVDASVTLPGSKSITNRALLLAALAEGTSMLRAPLHSEDTQYMAEALRNLGVAVTDLPNGDFSVTGIAGRFSAPAKPTLFIGNSGTTVRFLTAACTLLPQGEDVILDGVSRMRERPIRDLLSALLMLGAQVVSTYANGCPPVRIHGGGLLGGSCRLRGDVSSQFLSALLMVAPYAQQDVEILIEGELISKPYIDLTQSVMRSFGVDFENDNYQRLRVAAGQRYVACDYAIEADASNASYFAAAAAVTGGRVEISNLGTGSQQGDVQFINVLEQMGCTVTRGSKIVVQGPPRLQAIHVDMEHIPDTAQTLAVVAAFADGPSRITGLGSLRVKETDRIQAIACELPKLGVFVEEGPDYWVILPPHDQALRAGAIDTYDDHRMAMSFAVAGLRIPELVINDPKCVAKTFPNFWELWETTFPTKV